MTEKENRIIARNLRVERAKQHVSIQQLAQESGVSISTLSFIENAKTKNIRFATLVSIANALDVEVEDLLKEND